MLVFDQLMEMKLELQLMMKMKKMEKKKKMKKMKKEIWRWLSKRKD